MSWNRIIVLALIGVLVTSGLAIGAPKGSPDLNLFTPDNRVEPGEETELQVLVLNGGEVTLGATDPSLNSQVTTARNLRLTMEADDAPIEVQTSTQPVGNVPEGVSEPISFLITVAENAKPGEYRIPIKLEYRYTNQVSDGAFDSTIHQHSEVTRTEYITVRIEPIARFEIKNASMNPLLEDSGNVTLTVQNVGRAGASEARLTIESEINQLTFDGDATATTFVGQWSPGETKDITFESEVDSGIDDRTFPVSVTVDYKDDDWNSRQSESRQTGLTLGERNDRFAIVDTQADVAIGDSGVVTLLIQNTAQTAITDARVSLRSNDQKLSFVGPTTAESFVGVWGANETRRVTFEMDVQETADRRSYSLSAVVNYRSPDGERKQADSLVTGIVPEPEQSFEVRDVQSTLRVGQEGTIRGSLMNTGQTAIRNAVVVLESENPNVNPVETEYQVGRLTPLQSTSFSFEVEISDNAGAGPRQFSVRVRYRDTDDDIRRSEPLDLNVSFAPKEDTFVVEPAEATFEAGSSGSLTVSVRNAGDEVLTDISAKLFTNDPLSSSDDEAFITEIAPGEEARITFELSAASSSLSKIYPAEIDFQYDDSDGDSHLSDTYKVPVEVTEPAEEGGLPIPLVIAVVVLIGLGVGGFYWYRRS